MVNNVLLYPTLNEVLLNKIRFSKKDFQFYYTSSDEEEHELDNESIDQSSSMYRIKDKDGYWTQDEYNLCFRRKYCLRTFQCLFGENGIVCQNARLGMAIQWTSTDSKQRGIIRIGEFGIEDQIFEAVAEEQFKKAQLRGKIDFTTVLYVAKSGDPKENEKHLANENGYILGELDKYTIILDGKGSSFPIYEVCEPGQPLWYVRCEWSDPTTDAFSECVSINLNTAHKNYPYIDRTKKQFDRQLLLEIMASAITIIIEKVREEDVYWEQISQGDNLEYGSVGEAIFYFKNTLEWDLASVESVSLSMRKFFDKKGLGYDNTNAK